MIKPHWFVWYPVGREREEVDFVLSPWLRHHYMLRKTKSHDYLVTIAPYDVTVWLDNCVISSGFTWLGRSLGRGHVQVMWLNTLRAPCNLMHHFKCIDLDCVIIMHSMKSCDCHVTERFQLCWEVLASCRCIPLSLSDNLSSPHGSWALYMLTADVYSSYGQAYLGCAWWTWKVTYL